MKIGCNLATPILFFYYVKHNIFSIYTFLWRMYYYRLILLSIFFCFGIELKAQENSVSQIAEVQNVLDRPLNNISLNILGDASILSINFEKQYLIR